MSIHKNGWRLDDVCLESRRGRREVRRPDGSDGWGLPYIRHDMVLKRLGEETGGRMNCCGTTYDVHPPPWLTVLEVEWMITSTFERQCFVNTNGCPYLCLSPCICLYASPCFHLTVSASLHLPLALVCLSNISSWMSQLVPISLHLSVPPCISPYVSIFLYLLSVSLCIVCSHLSSSPWDYLPESVPISL